MIVFAGKPVGTITSFSPFTSSSQTIALGYVTKDCSYPDTSVTVSQNGISVGAKVTSLPFVRLQEETVSSS